MTKRSWVIYPQPETVVALDRVERFSTVDAASVRLGVEGGEPLLVCLDGLLRYAKAYRKRTGGRVSTDGVLGPLWREAVWSLKGLLNGDGAVAMERGITTDSKSNGAMDEIYTAAMRAGGFDYEGEALPQSEGGES